MRAAAATVTDGTRSALVTTPIAPHPATASQQCCWSGISQSGACDPTMDAVLGAGASDRTPAGMVWPVIGIVCSAVAVPSAFAA
jgi:hypothetical protein